MRELFDITTIQNMLCQLKNNCSFQRISLDRRVTSMFSPLVSQMALVDRPWRVFVFRAGVPMKTAGGLEMPSLLSKHTEGLRACVFVRVCRCDCVCMCAAEGERGGGGGGRSGPGAHCPVNTAGSDWRDQAAALLLSWQSAFSQTTECDTWPKL